MTAAIRGNHKILRRGNGGSAANSQHSCRRNRRSLSARVALHIVLITVGNDYDFDSIFVRQVEALCHAGNVLAGLTTAGNSPNMCWRLRVGSLGAFTVGLTGEDGEDCSA